MTCIIESYLMLFGTLFLSFAAHKKNIGPSTTAAQPVPIIELLDIFFLKNGGNNFHTTFRTHYGLFIKIQLKICMLLHSQIQPFANSFSFVAPNKNQRSYAINTVVPCGFVFGSLLSSMPYIPCHHVLSI